MHILIVDVNVDNKYDFIFYCHGDQTLNILLDNDKNSRFEQSNRYLFNSFFSLSLNLNICT